MFYLFYCVFNSCVGKILIWMHNWKNEQDIWILEVSNVNGRFTTEIPTLYIFRISAVTLSYDIELR